jgi:hypothetical protein
VADGSQAIQNANLPFDWDELKWIAAQAFRSNPRAFQDAQTRAVGGDYEASLFEDVTANSPLVDYVRQHLPGQLGDTRAGQSLPWNTPEWVQRIPLGGYSKERMELFARLRESNPEIRAATVQRDVTPEFEAPTVDVPIGDSGRRKAAQAFGVTMADTIGVQGLMNLWWLMNAGEAVTSVATLQGLHNAQAGISRVRAPLLQSRSMRMAATAPAWIAMKFANGSFGRLDGYGAASPGEGDRRESSSPVAEFLSEMVLGRSGELLPYREFVQERPDVTKGEYEQYKAFLHGNKWPIKFTPDGIHGAEVNFLGKSLPVATAIIPAVAMALGGRAGARRAALRLKESGVDPVSGEIGVDLLRRRQAAKDELVAIKRMPLDERPGPVEYEEMVEGAVAEHGKYSRAVENEVLKDVLAYGGGSLTSAALIGSTLESIRRGLRGKAPIEEEEEPGAAPAELPAAPRMAQNGATGGRR